VSRGTVRVSPPVASPRAASGHSTVIALASVAKKGAHLTDRPTRKWSRRTRRSCAILSPRRAAHLQL
jgi:hypothetical protein